MKKKLISSLTMACALAMGISSYSYALPGAADTNRDQGDVAFTRYLGTAVLHIGTDGTWYVGKVGQKISEYVPIKWEGQGGLNDDSFEFSPVSAEDIPATGGYLVYFQSNETPNDIGEVTLDNQGNIIGASAKLLSQDEWFAAEKKWGVDLNGNGGLGNQMILVDAGSGSDAVKLYLDGLGTYQVQEADKTFKPLIFEGEPLNLQFLEFYEVEIENVVRSDGGYTVYLSTLDDDVFEITTDATGALKTPSLQVVGSARLEQVEASTGANLNDKADTPLTADWTSSLKTAAIRTEVETQTANNGKITHAGLIKIVDAAIQSAGSGAIGADIFSDLNAISNRGTALFTSKDLAGTETDYLVYVFDKLVNGSKANNFYTGGTTTKQNLGNLSAESPADVLQKLTNKWLLGLDLPNPRSGGDTANPSVSAVSTAVYKTFNADLIVGGVQAFDVNQGSAGTCYLLASIASIAQAQSSTYNATFVSNGVGTNGSPTWGIRFFDNNNKPHWVTGNNQLVVLNQDDTNAAYTKVKGVDAQNSPTQELWAPLVEKAYAQANELGIFDRDKAENAIFAIDGGGARALGHLLGQKAYMFTDQAIFTFKEGSSSSLTGTLLPEGQTRLGEYTKALNSGQAFYVAPGVDTTNAAGASVFVSGHAFMIYDADPNDPNNTTVKMYNPWGVSVGPTFVSPFDQDLSTLLAVPTLSMLFAR